MRFFPSYYDLYLRNFQTLMNTENVIIIIDDNNNFDYYESRSLSFQVIMMKFHCRWQHLKIFIQINHKFECMDVFIYFKVKS